MTVAMHPILIADKIERMSAAWVDFNLRYQTEQAAKFSKYAKRLGRDLAPEQGERSTTNLGTVFLSERS